VLEIILLSIIIVVPLVVIFFPKRRESNRPPTRDKLTMLYAPSSTDEAGEAYWPARRGGAMPFPVGKKKERKKTETFRRSTKD
jgi:hypothetical protein